LLIVGPKLTLPATGTLAGNNVRRPKGCHKSPVRPRPSGDLRLHRVLGEPISMFSPFTGRRSVASGLFSERLKRDALPPVEM
jgi:hypothetical protein